ncbi:OmpP1/FadL family transporter [Bacteroides helcogenes]|uniref:Hemin receptor n=1 Tax=Bacteroides helcogenes (strain ATCC 35417 / DSM 20613 / JCM 6297 / CCUG 15421 / P 36-108) TaxID=693979 RepID=E6SNT6_BACT6|nr:outer membrane protein transport protein [Bacteroides helcogenes]ADV44819.1 hypothetical protein Bache_2884 [Bacteroides helcogenes P 36-108]MDY5239678.1 outer membrane protein transport protein [Bacteroides helcogenes]
MKKRMILATFATCMCVGAMAQTVYDGMNISSKDLNGTARFVGMGGALGALGGDISTIGTNPAGIGIYRSNDLMLSASYSLTGTESTLGSNKYSMSKARWNFDNMGFVYSTKIGDRTSLRYVNFAFNYQKVKSFDRNMGTEGNLGRYSQTFLMASMSDGIGEDMWKDNPFNHNEIGWLSALGHEGGLIAPDITTKKTDYPYKENGVQLTDKDGNPLYLDYGHYVSVLGSENTAYMREFKSRETGGINDYNFNVAFNFNDRFYLGFTLGISDVDYNKYTLYDEDFRTNSGESTGSGYILESFNKLTGVGFDFKVGAILRPFEDSPFRLGLALHTPTFYQMTWATSARLVSDLFRYDKPITTTVDSYDYLNNGDLKFEYQMNTPWTYNVSLGYTVGSQLALGAEYEYKDYATTKFKYSDGSNMKWQTNESKMCLKGVHALRLGAEYKVIPQFALRAGYNYISSAFKSDAVKVFPVESVNSDTDFTNLQSMNNYTLGIGYRGKLLYADLAYKYSVQKGDFYPFTYKDGNTYVIPEVTKVTNTRSQVLFTLGMRF